MIRKVWENGFKNGGIFFKKQTGIFSAALVLAVTFSFSALLGILRDRLLYAKFFACCVAELDAYNAAFRIPDAVFRLLVTGALSAAFIPVFSRQLEKDKKAAYKTASSLINILFLVLAAVTLIVFLFARPLSAAITANFSPNQVILMSQLTKIMIFAQLFFLLSNFLTGVLQSQQCFFLPSLAPIAYNLGIIFGIQAFSQKFGIFAPAFGVVLGAFCHFLIQLPLSFRLGFKYFPKISFKDLGVRKILKLMLPRTLSLGLGEIEATVALFLASALPAGSLSLFYLSQRLTHFFTRVFGVTIGQAALPIFAKQAAREDLSDFVKTVFTAIKQAVFFALPASAIFLVLRVPAVRLAYGAKSFPWRATVATGRITAFFAPLVLTNTVADLSTRAFYALCDTKTPLFLSGFALVINLVISLLAIFKFKMGAVGLALALSLSGALQALFLISLLAKKTKVKNLKEVLIAPFLKIFSLSIVAACFTWSVLRFLDFYVLDTSKTADLLVLSVLSGSVGFAIYLGLSFFFKLPEAAMVKKLFFKLKSLGKTIPPLQELPPIE